MRGDAMTKRTVTVQQAADALNLHPYTVAGYCQTGKIPGAFQLNPRGRWFIPDDYLDRMTNQATQTMPPTRVKRRRKKT